MLAAYFDESGTHADAPILGVAGFLASQADWLDCESKWRRALRTYRLREFHMVEFENRRGPYKKLTNRQRINLITRLIDAIGQTAWVGIAAAVVKEDYEAISASEKITFGSPYSFCANVCIRQLKDWLDERHIKDRVAYVFELGAPQISDLRTVFWKSHAVDPDRYHLLSLHFLDPRDCTQLQAADILAYETPKQAARTIGINERHLRRSLEQILKRVECRSALLDKNSIPKYVELSRKWRKEQQPGGLSG